MSWTTRSAAQNFALIFGMLYLLIGILGYVLVPEAGGKLFGAFSVNLSHSIAHAAIGLGLMLSTNDHLRAKRANLIVGIAYGALALLGLGDVVVDDLLEANLADDFLHLATATLAIFFGTVGAEGERSYA